MISIVIPLYNKRKYIGTTLQSVLDQTFTDYECLIIDDGSTDGSELIVKSFKDSRLKYFRQENSGVSSARNAGIRLAKGNYVAFLDADDRWDRHYLETMVGLTRRYPDEVFFSAAHTCVSTIKTEISVIRDYCSWFNICFTSGIIVKRVIFNEIFPPPHLESE